MEHVQLYKLAIDGGLILSLLYFCFRFSRTGTNGLGRRMIGLESGLRALIKDAEESGQLLNEKLVKRQSRLEELLFDLDSLEKRLARIQESADEARVEIGLQLDRGQKIVQSIREETLKPRRQTDAPRSASVRSEPPADESKPNWVASEEPSSPDSPAFYAEPEEVHDSTSADRFAEYEAVVERATGPEQTSWGAVNIFGEPIGQAASATREEYTPLAKAVEKEESPARNQSQAPAAPNAYTRAAAAYSTRTPVSEELPGDGLRPEVIDTQHFSMQEPTPQPELDAEVPYGSGVDAQSQLQQVYDAAERLLKAGRSVDAVSAATSLPLAEIEMLAQMVALEQEQEREQNPEPKDPRLGVLGSPVRRGTKTL